MQYRHDDDIKIFMLRNRLLLPYNSLLRRHTGIQARGPVVVCPAADVI
jgi:hypothetical protein